MFSFLRSIKKQKWGASLLVALVLVGQMLVAVQPARAVPTEETYSLPETIQFVYWQGKKILYASALSALVTGASYFARKVAYDTAVAIGSSGSGRGPLVFKDGIKSYLGKTTDETIGAAIEGFGGPMGINLCTIPDLQIQLYLKISLRRLYGIGGPPKPNCSWSSLKENWSGENLNKMYGGRDEIFSRFNADLTVTQSDFDIALQGISRIDQLSAAARESALGERIAGKGFKNLVGKISGNIKTPAEAIAEETKALGPGETTNRSLRQIEGIYGAGAEEILPMAGSVFLNTLASTVLDRFLKEGIFKDSPDFGSGSSGGSIASNSFGLEAGNDRRAVERAFNFLLTAPPVKDLSSLDLISEFLSCPENPGLNNCVINTDFQQLLTIASNGRGLTIREAMDTGDRLLKGEKPLISPRRAFQNEDVKNCVQQGYCYSNIQKLRKARVLPLGFEIAALKSDPDVPWTLRQVVDGFESDCQKVPVGPFCHLIDPNWIIKAPEARCDTNVYGPQLADSSSALRKRECVDISTCILEGANGECLDTYGYCTKEKNIWRMPGQSCPAQFATCKTFNSGSGQVVSYLARTVDYGECSIENVGCRAYSTEQARLDSGQAGTAWVASADSNESLKALGRSQVVQFNQNVETCDASKDGCTAFATAGKDPVTGRFVTNTENNFVRQDAPLLHLKKAPDYLGCYDTVRTAVSPQVDLPVTKADLQRLPVDENRCKSYARVCVKDEISCDGFTPLAGGVEVPGIIGGNSCPAQCVGYDVFKQEATNFEPADYPMYIIPNGAKCTSAEVGCDEFTNLEAASSGGEQLEYYSALKYCEKPTGTNEKVFYSWEGDSNQGFVLKVHRLLQIDAEEAGYIAGLSVSYLGELPSTVFPEHSPAYAEDTKVALQDAYSICNKTAYENLINNRAGVKANADCRALYDETGIIYYRLLAKTVSVSAECRLLRKTESNFAEDANLTAQGEATCTDKGGFWDNNKCQRCFSGGNYKNGVCEYKTIPSQARACTASANGCRLYIGNTGNNIELTVQDDFEPSERIGNAPGIEAYGWTELGLSITQEALQVGLSALRVGEVGGELKASRLLASGKLRENAWYELSFWARGSGQRLRIILAEDNNENFINEFTVDPISGAQTLVSLNSEWTEYSLGPVQFTGNADSDRNMLTFYQTNSGVNPFLFLDKVTLTKVADPDDVGNVGRIPMIKNSWKMPVTAAGVGICDSTLDDGLPGEYLGCRSYTNRAGDLAYATGFDSLCREEAIGCQPVWDTHNTTKNGEEARLAQAFNVWCPSASVQNGECNVTSEQNIVLPIKAEDRCTVGATDAGCYVRHIILPVGQTLRAVNVVTSTIIIPADAADSAPIYLAVTDAAKCQEFERGCMKAGLEEQILPDDNRAASFNHSDTAILNNPEKYVPTGETKGILCRDDLVGCGEYNSGATTYYFRDPNATGNKLCEYKLADSNTGEFGWFKKGVGQCSDNADKLCKTNEECGGTASCENIGTVSCYANNIARGGERGIWSNESAEFQGFVGMCGEEHNACTEILDVNDKSVDYPNGQPYYTLFDDERITTAKGECGGNVSLKEGCVLFDKTDNPNKIYNSVATYAASRLANDNMVPAEIRTGPMDSNEILKVNRDRTCGEWLACKSSIPSVNAQGTKVPLCYEYKSCRGTVQGTDCVDWVDNAVQESQLKERLTEQVYRGRNTGWNGMDYSGYSLFNKFQIDKYVYLGFDLSDRQYQTLQAKYDGTTYLAYKVDDRYFEDEDDVALGCDEEVDWAVCGADEGGRCYNGDCIYPVDGPFPTLADASTLGVDAAISKLTGGSCKSYPEQDSPYSKTIVQVNPGTTEGIRTLGTEPKRVELFQRNPQYSNVNFCQDGNCSCEYKKVVYKTSGDTDFWPLGTPTTAIPDGVCDGGTFDGQPCIPQYYNPDSQDLTAAAAAGENSICTRGTSKGTCVPIQKNETHIGVQGYCLEYDYSRPSRTNGTQYECLTWLPIDVSASNGDIYNTDTTAGYDINFAGDTGAALEVQGGQVYCMAATAAGSGAYDSELFIGDCKESAGEQVELGFYEREVRICPQDEDGCKVYFYLRNDDPQCFAQTEQANSDMEYIKRDFTKSQMWAWKNIGHNALVLRAENIQEMHHKFEYSELALDTNYLYFRSDTTHPEFKANYTSNPNDKIEMKASGVDDIQCPYCTILAFAPFPFNDNTEMGVGTVMHPPRHWGADVDSATVKSFDRYNYKFNDKDRYVDSQMMSPGTELDMEPIKERYVTRSPLEARINENDIGRVYFVPTGFPGGAEDVNPIMFTKHLYLDFAALSKSRGLPIRSSPAKVYNDRQQQFTGASDGSNLPDGLKIWSYKLESSDNAYGAGNGILSFTNYIDSGRVVNGSLLRYTGAADPDKRNEIASRYVMVWVGKRANQNMPPFFPTLEDGAVGGLPRGTGMDPFTAACEHSDLTDNNWMAIGMDFNDKGEFLGYISRWCNADEGGDGDNGIEFMVAATLNNQCTQYAVVYDDAVSSLTNTTNKAWTHRVWKYNKRQDHPVANYSAVQNSLANSPFGSLGLTGESVMSVPLATDIEGLRAYEWKLRQYTFRDELRDGIPYACGPGRPFDAEIAFSLLGGCQPLRSLEEFSSVAYPAAVVTQLSVRTPEQANDAIHSLFQKVFVRVSIDDLAGDNANVSVKQAIDFHPPAQGNTSIYKWDTSKDAIGTTKPPQIYSLNPYKCTNATLNSSGARAVACTPGEINNVTVQGKNGTTTDYNNDGRPDEDDNNNDIADSIIANGSTAVALQFFAFADDERMPIRRVMVDWDDGTKSRDQRGLYKNRKPFCESKNDFTDLTPNGYSTTQSPLALCVTGDLRGTPTGLTCRADGDCPQGQRCDLPAVARDSAAIATWRSTRGANDPYSQARFGDLPRACKPEYFTFNHSFTCGNYELAQKDRNDKPLYAVLVSSLNVDARDRVVAQGFSDTDSVCLYKPRVQVMDNWDWCNGMNSVTGDQNVGVYDGLDPDCAPTKTVLPDGRMPWTEYKGEVIVLPVRRAQR